jgi:myo-inositol-1-phosphate synthase
VQGIAHYQNGGANDQIGLMHWDLGGYRPKDIQVVAAWDVDRRKVGRDVAEAIFAKPNCTQIFCDHVKPSGAQVRMGRVLDGVADHMAEMEDDRTFLLADAPEPSQGAGGRGAARDGRRRAAQLPARSAARKRPNSTPNARSKRASLWSTTSRLHRQRPHGRRGSRLRACPIIGDDIKAQLGATIVHRVLTDLFRKRGVKLERTYQLNTGGNTDFLNMKERSRLKSKKISKTEAVQSVAAHRLDADDIHVGPIRLCGVAERQQGLLPAHGGPAVRRRADELEMRLSVEDSPNQRRRRHRHDPLRQTRQGPRLGGPIHPASAYFCKHTPAVQMTDDEAHEALEASIWGVVRKVRAGLASLPA